MKTASLWIIRVALTVQFAGVLAVPAIVAAAESPRGTWMAEWLRPPSIDPTTGVLRLHETRAREEDTNRRSPLMIRTPRPQDPKSSRPEDLR